LRYDESGTRRRHIPVIREFLKVKPFDGQARTLVGAAVRDAAQAKEDLADLINISIEELVRNRFELPGFTTLLKEARRGRSDVHRVFYRRVAQALGDDGRDHLDRILKVDDPGGRSPWNTIREFSGRPTLTHLGELVDRLHWLKSVNVGAEAFATVPYVKVQHFAAEARSLDAARMRETQPQKRYTMAASLIRVEVARTLDDLGDLIIKCITKIHRKGQEALAEYRERQQGRTDELIAILHGVVTALQGEDTTDARLAHLLGIDLMPRIRNWKELKLFRPSKGSRYEHIDELFTDVVDWSLIETHLPDMLRVVLSIRAGRISASTILRKLGTYSRKNRLYQAFQELGRVVRTVFLLRYLNDVELRRVIQAATNKSEAFNRFVQWLFFGGEGLIAENDRDRQRKLIKYNHLVANCLIFHNVSTQTRILRQLAEEGHAFDDETLSRLSPYLTEHVNRFGTYTLNLDRKSPAPDYTLGLRPEPEPALAVGAAS
jgi:TnpA family transposase